MFFVTRMAKTVIYYSSITCGDLKRSVFDDVVFESEQIGIIWLAKVLFTLIEYNKNQSD